MQKKNYAKNIKGMLSSSRMQEKEQERDLGRKPPKAGRRGEEKISRIGAQPAYGSQAFIATLLFDPSMTAVSILASLEFKATLLIMSSRALKTTGLGRG